MAEQEQGVPSMLPGLVSASHTMAFREIPAEVERYATAAGLDEVAIFMADLQDTVLRRMTGFGPDARQGADEQFPVEGTTAGRTFQYGRPASHPVAGSTRRQWWLPLLHGTDRLGVLRVTTGDSSGQSRQDLELLASVVALLLVGKSATSDAYARLVRTEAMSVAAEMQWHLLPPRTYADAHVVIGGLLEPAYQVGGDVFDYALAGNMAHLAVFDSMGHDTSAGVAASLALAACRNHRRQNTGLVETTVEIEKALIHEFERIRYVTAVLADLDLDTGLFTWVNRGHLPPLVIRGNRWSSHLQCPPAHPMGTDLGLVPVLCREQLEPGDRVVLYTDGITEARNPGGVEFGVDGFVDFLIRHHADQLPVPETLRRLMRSILEHHNGRLADDATVLIAEWLGPDP
ncbi:PP2C family protein-serine/threonine phosphatase [Streptomyces sp. NPDC002574]|uniref:PP2C family protein-serine/threonine phosphatase n=1 Tax=Streptomyces sp. NPDC002574 TaxID=3364652 RepID=UPI0036A49884